MKLPTEEKLVQSLVSLQLLLERGMIESLVKLVFLPQEEMFEPLENLDLKHDQGKRSPQVDPPIFLLQVINEELMQCE
jgi:hypothetical protein